MTFQALAAGPEDGPLLLLLHGLPRNRWQWHHQIPAMDEMGVARASLRARRVTREVQPPSPQCLPQAPAL